MKLYPRDRCGCLNWSLESRSRQEALLQ